MHVAYNDGMWMLMRVPLWSSGRQIFVDGGVPPCPVVLYNLMYRCMFRSSESENSIIPTLTNPGLSSV